MTIFYAFVGVFRQQINWNTTNVGEKHPHWHAEKHQLWHAEKHQL
jgi:hypothetical protein